MTSGMRLAEAASLALGLMDSAQASTWGDINLSAVTLTPAQQTLLTDAKQILPNLRLNPPVTISACPVCDRFSYVGAPATATGKCWLTLDCPGTPVRAAPVQFELETLVVETPREDSFGHT